MPSKWPFHLGSRFALDRASDTTSWAHWPDQLGKIENIRVFFFVDLFHVVPHHKHHDVFLESFVREWKKRKTFFLKWSFISSWLRTWRRVGELKQQQISHHNESSRCVLSSRLLETAHSDHQDRGHGHGHHQNRRGHLRFCRRERASLTHQLTIGIIASGLGAKAKVDLDFNLEERKERQCWPWPKETHLDFIADPISNVHVLQLFVAAITVSVLGLGTTVETNLCKKKWEKLMTWRPTQRARVHLLSKT